jgi:hypothetical protein
MNFEVRSSNEEGRTAVGAFAPVSSFCVRTSNFEPLGEGALGAGEERLKKYFESCPGGETDRERT